MDIIFCGIFILSIASMLFCFDDSPTESEARWYRNNNKKD